MDKDLHFVCCAFFAVALSSRATWANKSNPVACQQQQIPIDGDDAADTLPGQYLVFLKDRNRDSNLDKRVSGLEAFALKAKTSAADYFYVLYTKQVDNLAYLLVEASSQLIRSCRCYSDVDFITVNRLYTLSDSGNDPQSVAGKLWRCWQLY